MAFVAAPGDGYVVSFDLRRDKSRVRDHVLLARDFVAAAHESITASRPGPAVEAASAAAELVVKAMHLLHVVPTQKRASHGARLTWLNWYTRRDGNGSPDWYPAMKRLESLRPAARYSDGGSLPDAEELDALLGEIVELVDHAAAHGGVDEAEHPRSGDAG
ncbi:HEPN domain-containing protein [Nocardia sp. NRRL S-836]|uniref:HEPN domain-containing protein n=1 Tax=Nocardia sp. NRRL S-836 TaxID=1519492 RepID=UPI0006B02EE2|nr:HEPN domain-containing protein [Nocardia sp. NRRL S-836]KOV77716.1 hypothetical protein ADL03_41495 [Nocardia sp. NRRL S-836]